MLTSNSRANQKETIGDGSITSLIACLSVRDTSLKKKAVLALASLANMKVKKQQNVNIKRIAKAGGIEPLVALLSEWDADIKREICPLLAKLSHNKVNKQRVVEAGGIELLVALLSDSESGIRLSAVKLLTEILSPTANKKRLDKAGGVEILVASLSDPDTGVKREVALALRYLAFDSAMRKRIGEAGGIESLVALLTDSDADLKERVVSVLASLVQDAANQERIVKANAIEPLVGLLSAKNLYVKQNAAEVLSWLTWNTACKERFGEIGIIEAITALLTDTDRELRKKTLRILVNLAVNTTNQNRMVQAGAIRSLMTLLADWETDVNTYATKLFVALIDGSVGNVIPRQKKESLLPVLRKRLLESSELDVDDRRALERLIEFLETDTGLDRTMDVMEGVNTDVDIEKSRELSVLLNRSVYAIHSWEQPLDGVDAKRVGDYVTFSERFTPDSYTHMDKQIDYMSTFVVHSSCVGDLALKAMGSFSQSFLVIDDLERFNKEELLQALSRLRCIDTLYLSLSEELIDFINPLFPILPRNMHIVIQADVDIAQRFLSILPPGFTVSLCSSGLDELIGDLPPDTVYADFLSPIVKASDQKGVLSRLPVKTKMLCQTQDDSLDALEGKKVVLLESYEDDQKNRLAKEKKRAIISAATPLASYPSLMPRGVKCFLYNDLSIEHVDALFQVLKSRPLLVSSLVSTSCIQKLLDKGMKIKFGSQMGISEKYLNPLPYHLVKGCSLETVESPYLPPNTISFKRLDDVIAKLVGRAKDPKKRYRKNIDTCGVRMHLVKPFQGYDTTKPTVFILAGRKERAMLPPLSKKYNLILVITPVEFALLFQDTQEEQATLSYLQALIIDSIHRPYKSEQDDISTITSRRLAVLLTAEKLGLEHFIMLDDNIDQVNVESESSFFDVYQSMLKHSQMYQQSFVSVASYSQKHKRYDQTSLGSKCHLWNATVLKQYSDLFSLNRRSWISLMPQNEHYWGQVLYAQLVLRELAGTNLATSIYPCKEMVLIRSQQSRNSTQLRGVRAKPLPFTQEYQSFLQEIDPILYQIIERVICIFNYQVNEQIKMNQSRIDRLLTLDLEKQQAAANDVPLQMLALPNVDKTIHQNVRDCLSSLISKRPAIEAQPDGFKPYDHQWRALEYAVKTIDDTRKLDMILYEMATGSGKTFIQTVLCLAILASTEGTVVYLSPRIELAEQSYQSMIGFIDRFPALSQSFSISKSKILKMFSGSDAALTKDAILANECLHPRYLMIACKDSFYRLLDEVGFREHLRFIVFDESHLTFRPGKFYELSDMINHTNFITFSATPFCKSMTNRFCFGRREAIQKHLLAPLHIDRVPNMLLRNKQGPRLEQVKIMVASHRLPGGKLLIESKGIIFVKSQPEAEALVGYLNRELPGIACYQISSDNKKHKEELELYREKSVAIAVAVDMLIVGFDNSKVTWCVNLKTQISRHKRIQAHGRFLRRDNENPHKIGTIIMLKSIKKGRSIFPEGFSIPETYVRAKLTLAPESTKCAASRVYQKKSKAGDLVNDTAKRLRCEKTPRDKRALSSESSKRKKTQTLGARKRSNRASIFHTKPPLRSGSTVAHDLREKDRAVVSIASLLAKLD